MTPSPVPDPVTGSPLPFVMRPPSTEWEWTALDEARQNYGWVWFRPAGSPQSVLFRIPDETGAITFRSLLQSTAIDPGSVATWNVYGAVYQGPAVTTPMLDQVLPDAPAGADPSIAVYVHPPVVATMPMPFAVTVPAAMALPTMAATPAVTGTPVNSEVYERIAAHWTASQELEAKLVELRKQLHGMTQDLKGLNRDLTYEEGNVSDRKDRDDWAHARRWMKTAAVQISRAIKAYDVGDTKVAGTQQRFQTIYLEYILPKAPLDNILTIQGEYEHNRKLLQTLQSQMYRALTRDGEAARRYAHQVLREITVKLHSGRSKPK